MKISNNNNSIIDEGGGVEFTFHMCFKEYYYSIDEDGTVYLMLLL